MRILEYGTEQEKALLFLPCTAEPARISSPWRKRWTR